jgi:hypothetical protein
MVIGGTFSTVCVVARGNVARILAGSTVDPAFDPVVAGEVRTLTTHRFSRTIYAVGHLTSVDGTARTRLATRDAAAVGVIVGGSFSQAGGVTRPCLARCSTAGSGTSGPCIRPGACGVLGHRRRRRARPSLQCALGAQCSHPSVEHRTPQCIGLPPNPAAVRTTFPRG